MSLLLFLCYFVTLRQRILSSSFELERSWFKARISLKKFKAKNVPRLQEEKLDSDMMMVAKAMELKKELQKLVRDFSSLFSFFSFFFKPTKKKIIGSLYF
jgi:hypothetical protein